MFFHTPGTRVGTEICAELALSAVAFGLPAATLTVPAAHPLSNPKHTATVKLRQALV